MSGENPYRALPSVDSLAADLEGLLPWPLLVDVARSALDKARKALADGDAADARAMAGDLARALLRSSGVPVVNATGVLLHTNLGRARWSQKAVERAALAATSYTNVELDLESGRRSRRGSYLAALLRSLTGAGDALVVNNNASALLLALAATSRGMAVPVARGELIEIGGSYRLPELVEASGAQLVEVGTTNRTRAGDYQVALQTHRCGSILKVHPSNYRIEGFTEQADLGQLATLAHSHGVPLIHDIGSGLLDANTPWLEGPPPTWLRGEPAVRQSLEEGADLVMFSGDKLLGGPQAGIVVGHAETIAKLRQDPLSRALRVDGVTQAALAATLEAFASGEVGSIPFWRQATVGADELTGRSASLARTLGGEVIEGHSTLGAGSAPGITIPSPLVLLAGEDHLFECLIRGEIPVLARRESGGLVFDLRTVEADADEVIVTAVRRCR